MAGELEQGSGTDDPAADERLEEAADPGGLAHGDLRRRVDHLRARAGLALERAAGFARRQPRPLVASLAAAFLLTAMGLMFPGTLTAALRAALPERIAGIIGQSERSDDGCIADTGRRRALRGTQGRAARIRVLRRHS